MAVRANCRYSERPNQRRDINSNAMYHLFFGLREPAFSIAVNPRYLYLSEQHQEALAHLLFGLQGGGFVQLTGEVGTGKTTIIRRLLEELPADTDIALILNPTASVPELLASICDELHASYEGTPSPKALTDALYQRLLDNHRRGRKTVLLIDEAQLLSAEALEQIRLLTNLETHTEKLLNIILVGQPELGALLARPGLRQLAQRITARYHLTPLSQAETGAYIRHRLQVAGADHTAELFSPARVADIHRFSGGVPRLINMVCERMLLGAYGRQQTHLDRALFEHARAEITGDAPLTSPAALPTRHEPGSHWPKLWGAALGGAMVSAIVSALVVLALLRAPTPETSAPELPPASTAKEQAPSEVDQTPMGISDLGAAQRQLANALSLPVMAGDPLCVESTTTAGGYRCVSATPHTWNALMDLNRPVVLSVMDSTRKAAYLPLLGLNEDRATVLTAEGKTMIAWRDLAPRWTGEVHYFRYRPPGFDGSLSAGERGPAVRWLAEQFAQMDGEARPLSDDRYTPALRQRVEIFQRRHGLTADGVFGENTLEVLTRAQELDPAFQPMAEAP